MNYGTFGLVSISKRKPRWLLKIAVAIILAGVIIAALLMFWHF